MTHLSCLNWARVRKGSGKPGGRKSYRIYTENAKQSCSLGLSGAPANISEFDCVYMN